MWQKNLFRFFHRRKKAETLVADTHLSPRARQLLELLRARAKDGKVQLSQAELAELLGWHRNTVGRYLRVIQKAGWVIWERQPNQPNCYRLTRMCNGVQPASLEPSRSPPTVAANQEGQTPPKEGLSFGSRDGALLGREEVLLELERLASKGANVLILGFEGMGKTHLVRQLSCNGFQAPCDATLHFSTPVPAKDFFLNLAEELARLGELGMAKDEDPYKLLGKLKIQELFKLTQAALSRSKKRFLLVIDDLDQITPSMKPLLQELFGLRNVQVIATAKTSKPRYASLWHHFFTVELGPISKEASDRVVEEFLEERGIPVVEDDGHRSRSKGVSRGRELLKERLYRRSRGNPRELFTLLRKIEVHGYVDRRYLQEELGAGTEHEYIDMTWLVIMTAAVLMAARYLGLGLHDRGLYILAGISYAAMILIRWLSYRWRR